MSDHRFQITWFLQNIGFSVFLRINWIIGFLDIVMLLVFRLSPLGSWIMVLVFLDFGCPIYIGLVFLRNWCDLLSITDNTKVEIAHFLYKSAIAEFAGFMKY